MPKIYLINEIIMELIKQRPLTEGDIEITKQELRYKTYRELENLLDSLCEQNK